MKQYHEEYEEQRKYADLLFLAIAVPWRSPIKKLRAMGKAWRFRDAHRKCCAWANED